LLDVKLSGKKDGEILVFVHGWPDNGEIWNKNVPAFEPDYHCAVVDLPNFRMKEPEEKSPSWGYSIDELASCFELTVHKLLADHKKDSCTVIAHDFGSLIAAFAIRRNPSLYSRAAHIDVWMRPEKRLPLTHIIIMGVAYQYWNAFLFLLQWIPIFGTPAADLMNRFSSQTICKSVGGIAHTSKNCPAAGNYLYFYYHLNKTQEALGLCRLFDQIHEIPQDRGRSPVVPTLFMYAADKPIMFHGKSDAKKIAEKKDGSKVVAIGKPFKEEKKIKIGHWLQFHGAEQFNKELRAWLA